MSKFPKVLLGASCALALFACAANGQTNLPIEPMQNEVVGSIIVDPPRVIAVGDVHGDYQRFVEILQAAEIIDKKHRWIGGDATLVQVGDLTDRGAESRKAIDLLIALKKQAEEQGGSVQVVIGNHEVMNVTGDLRFVHPGEYKAFKDARSKANQNAYYTQTVAALRAATPKGERFKLAKKHKKEWKKEFPLGYVEHRLAWAPTGDYGKWTLSNSAIVKVNHVLFVHGGISEQYSNMPLAEINTRVRTEIIDSKLWGKGSIIDDPAGPFWYRGWATMPETPENEATLDRILKAFDADRMVIAHTPLLNTILPRFGGKILMVDVGMSAHYGGANAALELVGTRGQIAQAIVSGERLVLPSQPSEVPDYLLAAAEIVDDDSKIQKYVVRLKAELEGQLMPGIQLKEATN